MVLERLAVDIKDELTRLAQFLVEVNSGFYTTNFVLKHDWECGGSLAKGNACFVFVSLVEGDVYGLVLGEVLGD